MRFERLGQKGQQDRGLLREELAVEGPTVEDPAVEAPAVEEPAGA